MVGRPLQRAGLFAVLTPLRAPVVVPPAGPRSSFLLRHPVVVPLSGALLVPYLEPFR